MVKNPAMFVIYDQQQRALPEFLIVADGLVDLLDEPFTLGHVGIRVLIILRQECPLSVVGITRFYERVGGQVAARTVTYKIAVLTEPVLVMNEVADRQQHRPEAMVVDAIVVLVVPIIVHDLKNGF